MTLLLPLSSSSQNHSQSSEAVDVRDLVLQLQSELKQTRKELANAELRIERLSDEMAAMRTARSGAESETTPPPQGQYLSPLDVADSEAKQSSEPSATQGDDVSLLRARVEEQQQTKVESASRYRVKLSGLILMNAFSTGGSVNVPALPNRATNAGRDGNFGATVRQSIVGLQVIGPTIAKGRTSANVSADFFGGFPQMSYGTTNGLVRLREAYGRIDWTNDSVLFGQTAPIISPLSPTSYATLAEPAFSWAGNLWVWTPQATYEHRFHTRDDSYFSVSGSLMDPLTEEIPRSSQNYTPGPGEISRRPALAVTIGWNSKLSGQSAQIGIGGYNSHLNFAAGREFESWAATAYWKLPISRLFEFSGEAYRGMGVGGLGGSVWQTAIYDGPPDNFSTTVRPLNSVGGWAQFKYRALPKLEFNAALGDDNVLSYDFRFAPQIFGEYTNPIARNRVAFGNAIYRPRSNLVFSLEYRELWTYRYTGLRSTANQVNIAAGVSF